MYGAAAGGLRSGPIEQLAQRLVAQSDCNDQLSSGRRRRRSHQLHHPGQLDREGGSHKPAAGPAGSRRTSRWNPRAVRDPDLHAVRGTMSSQHSTTIRRLGRGQRGFTLVELMVTVAIALFLLGGLLTILQNVRSAYNNQQSLSQLQDQQRIAMTVITDVIQAGGYFPDPVAWTATSSLPAAGAYQQGQAFTGTHAAGVPDTIGVRYRTTMNDPVGGPMILCDGSTNTTQGPSY